MLPNGLSDSDGTPALASQNGGDAHRGGVQPLVAFAWYEQCRVMFESLEVMTAARFADKRARMDTGPILRGEDPG